MHSQLKGQDEYLSCPFYYFSIFIFNLYYLFPPLLPNWSLIITYCVVLKGYFFYLDSLNKKEL